ncbi:DUF6445 family protein [Parvularcula marina]|uniref:Uncharacterized protein n=1 Tax=Parvularcula marina TaxID=2292771 RepID=A0A371RHW5_9PROT|nr:DUF6445 family protein [Parvularcula marina]RFB05046.1 hypothetical protein DX908_06920 [Parvularcula marina]
MSGHTLQIDRIGFEEQPVIHVDNAFPDPEQLVEMATTSTFDLESAYYPGVRAPAPKGYLESVRDAIASVGPEAFGWQGGKLSVHEGYFSIVTKSPEELMPIQCIPHYDGTDTGIIAVLHYLCPPGHGGTAFYRHRTTGFETITEGRQSSYKASLEADARREGMPQHDYIRGSSAMFEQTAAYEARFNRLLAYRGCSLHSGMIPENPVLSDNPREGRLTLNTFLFYEG